MGGATGAGTGPGAETVLVSELVAAIERNLVASEDTDNT